MPTIEFAVSGWPPIKNEARSLFAAGHAYRDRVEQLLDAARGAAVSAGWVRVSAGIDLALDVVIRSPMPRPPADATNFLGGIGDVLQGRTVSPTLDLSHLGDLATVALFDDDRQIQQVTYRVETGSSASYTVRLTTL